MISSISTSIRKFWDIKPPRYLKPNKRWNGVTITPAHQQKQVLQTIKKEVIVITPIHEEPQRTITRTFGDILSDEVEI